MMEERLVLCLADGRLRFGLEGEKEIKKCTNPCQEDQGRTDYVTCTVAQHS